MNEKVIRVQLPGGAMYQRALLEAASKTASRSGLPKTQADALVLMVRASVELLTDRGSSTINLEMAVHDDALWAKLAGKKCTAPTAHQKKAIKKLAATHASAFSIKTTKSAVTVSFTV